MYVPLRISYSVAFKRFRTAARSAQRDREPNITAKMKTRNETETQKRAVNVEQQRKCGFRVPADFTSTVTSSFLLLHSFRWLNYSSFFCFVPEARAFFLLLLLAGAQLPRVRTGETAHFGLFKPWKSKTKKKSERHTCVLHTLPRTSKSNHAHTHTHTQTYAYTETHSHKTKATHGQNYVRASSRNQQTSRR
jgi:hypothetical protein